jgi:hypothetical protein
MPKSTNPTNKELDDSIQAATQQFEEAINNNNNRLTTGLGEVNTTIAATNDRLTAELGILNTKLDNQQHLLDSREERFHRELAASNESLKIFITEALKAHGVTTAPATSTTTTVGATTSAATTPATIAAANSSTATASGTPLSPTAPPGYETILPQNSTPIQTPIHTTTLPLTLPISHHIPIFPTTPITVSLHPPYQHGTFTPPILNTSVYPPQPPPPPFPPPPYSIGSTHPMFSPSYSPYSTPQQQLPSYPNFMQNFPHP